MLKNDFAGFTSIRGTTCFMYAGILNLRSPLNQQLCLLTQQLLHSRQLMNIYFKVPDFFMSLYKPLIYFVPAVSPDLKIDVIPSFLIDMSGIG